MKCPYCKREMAKGTIRSTRTVAFVADEEYCVVDEDLGENITINNFNWLYTSLTAYRCPSCLKIIVNYGKSDNAREKVIVETRSLIVRNMKFGDFIDLQEVYSNPNVMKYVEEPFTLDQTKKFITDNGLGKKPLIYSIYHKEDKKVIGHVIYHETSTPNEYEFGWVLNEEYWGRTYASALVKAFRKIGEKKKIILVLQCDKDNEKVAHIAKKFDFEYMGTEDNISVYKDIYRGENNNLY